jgi:hypothetical protein
MELVFHHKKASFVRSAIGKAGWRTMYVTMFYPLIFFHANILCFAQMNLMSVYPPCLECDVLNAASTGLLRRVTNAIVMI